MTDNIQHLRLTNGEELVGDILFSDDYQVLIDNPLVLEERDTGSGSALVLSQYIPYSTSTVCNISKKHIITQTELHEELVRYYYYSLKFAYRSTEKSLREIKRVNDLMQAVVEEDELLESIDQTKLVKGSNSIN